MARRALITGIAERASADLERLAPRAAEPVSRR
jgi:hypothetical protein